MEQATLVPNAGEAVLESVKVDGHGLLLMMLRASGEQNLCPQCHRSSTRVHSHYQRKLRDLPWEGIPVRIQLHVRRFFCDTEGCGQRIFTERLPNTVHRYARRTCRLSAAIEQIALALGGSAGSRLAQPVGPKLFVCLQAWLRAVIAAQRPDCGRTCRSCPLAVIDAQEVADRAQVRAAHLQPRFQRLPHPLRAMFAANQEHVDHGPCSSRSAFAFADRLPEAVVAGGPAPLCTTLLQSRRSRQRSRLLQQCVQVVLQFQHLLMPPIAALMPSHTTALMPDLHV